jgi:hypothetical protein
MSRRRPESESRLRVRRSVESAVETIARTVALPWSAVAPMTAPEFSARRALLRERGMVQS